jgi:fatty acid desaturase
MQGSHTEASRVKASNWKQSAQTIVWSAVIWGTVLAVGSYLGAIAPKSEWMRKVFMGDVRADTFQAFARRFVLGAAGGAVIGVLLAIRDLRGSKGSGDKG